VVHLPHPSSWETWKNIHDHPCPYQNICRESGAVTRSAVQGERVHIVEREIVKQLLDEGRDEALVHREVLKPWGAYKVLDRGEAYQLGWLDVLPGEQLSLKNHIHRASHWIVVAGTATVTVNDRIVDVFCGEHIHAPEGSLHRVENRGSEKLRMIEIQTMSVVS